MSEKYSAGSKPDSNPFEDKNEYQYDLGRIASSESSHASNVTGNTKDSTGTTSNGDFHKKDDEKGSLAMFLKTKDIPFLILATALICVTSVASPLQSILFGQAFEKLTSLYSGGYTSFHGFISDVRLLCGKIIIVGAVKMVFTWSGIFSWMNFGELQQTRARKRLFRHLLSKDSDWYDTKENLMGDITQTNRCIEELRAGTSEVIGLLVQTIASVIALFVTAMVHSWLLTIVILAGSPLLALSGWYFGKLTCNAAKLENEASAQASKVLNWTLVASSSVRVLGGKYAEMVRFNKIVETSAKAYFKVANAIAANGAFLKTLVLMMFVQGFWFGNHLIKIGRLETNQVFTCFSSCLLLGTEISNLNHILAILNKAHAAAENIANMAVEFPTNASSSHVVDPIKCVGDICLRNVHFKYSTREEFTLKGVSFNIKPHKMNFIVGESGSGKSTISQLLMKYYSVTSGSISIDGIDFEAINPAWLTNNFTLVDQSPFIFNDTLKNNLGVAVVNKFTSLDDVPEPLLSDACTFALLNDAILVLDKGWDTPISQNKLSGGQNQRIALARAKLRDTPILILDEALSALDTYNSDKIFELIRNWRHGKTTIVITHTLRQILRCDYVVVMDNGFVKNQGYFEDVMYEPIFQSLQENQRKMAEYSEFTATDDSDDDHSLDYLKNPAILQDLEANAGSASGKICDLSKDGCEKIMSVFSILKYCSATITKKPLIGCGIIAALLEGVGGPVFSFTFAKLLNNMVNTAIGKDVGSALIKWSCTVIGISFGIGISRYLSLFLLAFASENWIVNLRKLAFVKINEQDMSFFDMGNTPAELTTLIMNDTRDLRSLVAEFLSLSINLVSLVLVGIVWSIVAGWKLALTGIAFVPLILIITGVYGQILAKSEAGYKAQVFEIETLQHETVTNMKAVVGMDLKAFFSERFGTQLITLRKLSTTRAIYTGFGLALSEVCISAATGTILYYGMRLAGRHEYSSDKLLQVITLLTFTMSSASSLIEQLPEISRGQRAGTFVIKLLSLESSPVEAEGQLMLQKLLSDPVISFNKTNFSYQQGSGKPALKNVTFSICKHEIFGILGESGSGKSTVGSILARLYRADPGSVQVFGQELNDFDVDWLREKLTLVPQHPKFFEGTLRNNLVYGLVNKSLTDGEIYDALKLVNMHSFVLSLPEGLYSRLGEGSNCMLSDGQLQRLSIARGLIRKPEILILDECTSNLDQENTSMIIDLISNNIRGKLTILIITHEPQLMKVTDSLIVLKDGNVVERGTYNSLLGSNTELSRITNRI